MSNYSDLMVAIRQKVRDTNIAAIPTLTEQMTAAVANRVDWRTEVAKFEKDGTGLGPPWAVSRLSAFRPTADVKPAAFRTQEADLDIYVVTTFRNPSDGTMKSDEAVAAELDGYAGALVHNYQQGGLQYFTVSSDITVEVGDTLDANQTFFQYKLDLQAIRVRFKIWTGFTP